MHPPISDEEFEAFRHFAYTHAGISLHQGKKALVCGRLGRRLQHHQLPNYSAYMALITGPAGAAERQLCIDLLTTNETYFFREPKHFDWLRDHLTALPPSHQTLRVWSAASSSGEEAYTLAMVLAEHARQPWRIVGTDISTRMIERARTAHYPLTRAQHVPVDYLKRYCLRGTGPQEGTLLVRPELCAQVDFVHANLNATLPQLGPFDVVFLRNVMIYFDTPTKQAVVDRLVAQMRPGAFLCVGHSESLNDLRHSLEPIAPAIFRKPCTVDEQVPQAVQTAPATPARAARMAHHMHGQSA